MPEEARDLEAFEAHKPALLALGYRMLGDFARAEDMVQEAWLRWRGRHDADVDSPKAYLFSVVTRLCLTELDSARARLEESRSDRLPEPVDLGDDVLGRLELVDQVSMAFLVVLQRLTPLERAVFVLREVFDFGYPRISAVLGRSEAACRQILRRARAHVAAEGRVFSSSPEVHKRLLHAFIDAATAGDVARLVAILADDAVMITDGGPQGVRSSGIRNLPRPLLGAERVAASSPQRGRAAYEGMRTATARSMGSPRRSRTTAATS
jgi:RNA polymerase sigma-70 factor (ECF subfamily)